MTTPTGSGGRPRGPGRGEWVAVAAPLALWGITLLLVSPRGDFPLNDDWIYGAAVKSWLETGHYSGHPFSTASLVAQAGWGAAFCGLFGFSFTVLRWSTLLLWAVAACVTVLMARRVGAARWTSGLAGCLVIANPLALNLGYTFMTDVPFMAFTALAGYGYLRAMEAGRARWLLWGSAFGLCALLTRQFALILPVALLLACLPGWRVGMREVTAGRAAAFLGPWLVGLAVLPALPGDPAALGHIWLPQYLGETLALQLFGGVSFYAASLVYLSLFALPLLAGAAWKGVGLAGMGGIRRIVPVAVVFALLTTLTAALPPRRLPYLENILYDLGLGPMTLRGNLTEHGDLWTPQSWGAWWWIPTLLGLAGAAWLVMAAFGWLRPGPDNELGDHNHVRRTQRRFLLWWVVLSLLALYHPWLPVRFDRYLLGALVPLLVLLAGTAGAGVPRLRVVQVALVTALFAFSVAAQHDYLAWNRARWEALSDLMAKGVAPEAIDGGYEFNGWHTSHHFIEEHGAHAFVDSGPKGWWVVENTWAIGWRPRPGYTIRETIRYDTWLGPEQQLLVIERE